MQRRRIIGRGFGCAVACLLVTGTVGLSPRTSAQCTQTVTFTRDIAPILHRSCHNCHNPEGGATMSLVTYEEVRPWARAIKARTASREMPPWFVEPHIGVQRFKDDPRLSDQEIEKIAAWADSDAPRGNPADIDRKS